MLLQLKCYHLCVFALPGKFEGTTSYMWRGGVFSLSSSCPRRRQRSGERSTQVGVVPFALKSNVGELDARGFSESPVSAGRCLPLPVYITSRLPFLIPMRS